MRHTWGFKHNATRRLQEILMWNDVQNNQNRCDHVKKNDVNFNIHVIPLSPSHLKQLRALYLSLPHSAFKCFMAKRHTSKMPSNATGDTCGLIRSVKTVGTPNGFSQNSHLLVHKESKRYNFVTLKKNTYPSSHGTFQACIWEVPQMPPTKKAPFRLPPEDPGADGKARPCGWWSP